jgi:phage terminase large subunit-like protein
VSVKDQIRLAAEADLEKFINLVHPQRMLGGVHSEVIKWMTRPDAKSHQLILLPRDHQKSAIAAYWVAWEITRNPCIRVLYVSSTSTLAVKQIKFIKDILTCDQYRKYWPEMVNQEEALREKWTETEFSVDHPLRKAEAIRDATVFTAGLTTSITGLHCDVAVLDDVVVYENAYTEDGRAKVSTQYSFLASIEGTEGLELVVGTRYHAKDLYDTLLAKKVEIYDEEGELVSEEPLYEVFERKVENSAHEDGTGEYLWPVQRRKDGKTFGFSQQILAKKRAQYIDRLQFKAQYYNNPHDSENIGIPRECFQYYERSLLNRSDGRWAYKGQRLNVFAAIDFAFSIRKESDYTCIVVVGCDARGNYYVMDIDRFKTDAKISDYFQHLLTAHQKWDFRKVRAEVTVAQAAVVKSLKDDYIKPHGLSLGIEEFRPSRKEGTKEERIESVLQPKYTNRQIWHYQGGNCQVLEEELVMANPSHDDVKDALASAIEICIMPTADHRNSISQRNFWMENANSRFGGLA